MLDMAWRSSIGIRGSFPQTRLGSGGVLQRGLHIPYDHAGSITEPCFEEIEGKDPIIILGHLPSHQFSIETDMS